MPDNHGVLPVPQGESNLGWSESDESTGNETCAICGAYIPLIKGEEDFACYSVIELPHALENSRTGTRVFLGCCGKFIDNLYEDLGDRFAIRFLREFAANPGDPKFDYLRNTLSEILPIAKENTAALKENVDKLSI